jgi:TAG lipase / steryl ester hydrolase / phospholipase A2 / LPA acyltransferase
MVDDRIRKFRKMLAEAPNYEVWKAAALELDFLEGNVEWKEEFGSDLYHYELIYDRLSNLRTYRQQNDFERLKRALREGLHHDLGNMGNTALYTRSRVGTKHLIEEYINQACESLDFLCDTKVPGFPVADKLQFFRDTLTSYGRPALLLSGGATLGMFHFGVIKALWEKGLLPQVIAGSSIGAIIAGILGVHSDAEIPDMLVPENHDMRAWKWRGLFSAIRGDGLMDQEQLKACLRANIGEYTFEEAFQKTGRSINVSVSPVQTHQKARLLCGYTSPYLLVWSAVLASAAVPGIFPPVPLMKKDIQGNVLPYMSRLKFVDGSVVSDLPIERLMHLYDVNFTIVSQTNPHVVPFLNRRGRDEKLNAANLPMHLLKSEIQFHGQGLFDYLRKRVQPEMLRQVAGQIYTIMGQRYSGDVTISPTYRLRDYRRMLSNPDPAWVREMILQGERATWPKISMIRSHARISKTLERCIRRLKSEQRRSTAELRLVSNADSGTS